MKINNYKGYNDEMKYREGVLTLLESLIEEVKSIKETITPKEVEAIVEPVIEVVEEVKPVKKTRKKKEVV